MGTSRSGPDPDGTSSGDEVSFDHFEILRAVGRGSFGKVCIVQKKNSKALFAMKYMNKALCAEKEMVKNVLREMQMLQELEHPFLVNLWFTFHDVEDMFMVVDLLLGGDLRYHLQQGVLFTEPAVLFYITEIALALDYLRQKRIIHRDLKPDNLLFDEEGHIHLTDFNVATVVNEDGEAKGLSGTKPYIAPEAFAVQLKNCASYSFPFDWWSAGVVVFEMLTHQRPFDLRGSAKECLASITGTELALSSKWSDVIRTLIQQLLCLDPDMRLSSPEALRDLAPEAILLDAALAKNIAPPFVPRKDHLNCDPTFELEEMIIEAKPLHKKKKRLAKRSKDAQNNQESSQDSLEAYIEKNFVPYNRERRKSRLDEDVRSGEIE